MFEPYLSGKFAYFNSIFSLSTWEHTCIELFKTPTTQTHPIITVKNRTETYNYQLYKVYQSYLFRSSTCPDRHGN